MTDARDITTTINKALQLWFTDESSGGDQTHETRGSRPTGPVRAGGLHGCRSQQLACDQDQFRSRILELYTNQIMDNLVRVDQGLPIVQMDYTNITGTVTQNATAGFSNTQTTADGKTLGYPRSCGT